jgi:hypothetical protein
MILLVQNEADRKDGLKDVGGVEDEGERKKKE